MAITKKQPAGSSQSSAKNKIIKVNPYENPENVMELMSMICSATPSADTDLFWGTIQEEFSKEYNGVSLNSYLNDNKESLYNRDFINDANNYCRQISWNLTRRENTEYTRIVVAGGFSSGKSSFLNKLTQCANLLPTGTEPVSVVQTYLYCSKDTREVSIKGVNPKNVLVDLDSSVLQAIKHSKESKVYLASVLDKLFVEIPSTDLDGLVFIDTPGYNNSDTANKSNGKTDQETAVEALGEGDVLFWLVDCEKGNTVTKDLEMIKHFNGKKVIIFNKADKKGSSECEKIIDQAALTIFKEIDKKDIIDILAFSTLDNKIYYSYYGRNFVQIIQAAKRFGKGSNDINEAKSNLETLFDIEICDCNNSIQEIKTSYKENQDLRDKWRELYNNDKNERIDIKKQLTEVLVKSYNTVINTADKLIDINLQTLNDFVAFYNEIMNFENNDHWGSSDILTNAINTANSRYSKDCDAYNASWQYEYYKEEYRKALIDDVDNMAEQVVDRSKEFYEECENSCTQEKSKIENFNKSITLLQNFKVNFMSAINVGINNYLSKNKATTVSHEVAEVPNVFEVIKKNDYKAFLRSFENGVDISVCNPDGYNPMTLAAQKGNSMMVQFLLEHNADPSIKDNRGYNAFHTAVENQNRSICQILLDYDPDLVDEATSHGESVEELANKQTFTKWFQSQI